MARLRADGLGKKANRVESTLEDDDYLEAARVAREAMGPGWFPFLQAQFDPDLMAAHPASFELARAIWKLGSPLVITTNYDRVLRHASPQPADLRMWTPGDRASFVDVLRGALGRPGVWHLHGFIDRPEEIILTPDGYRMLYPPGDGGDESTYTAALTTLRDRLAARSLLFVGFGLEEALQRQIEWVHETFAGGGGQHFIVVSQRGLAAMEAKTKGLPVQPVVVSDFGGPLLDLLAEMAGIVATSGPPHAHVPTVALDEKPYLEYHGSESAFIEIRGLQRKDPNATRFPIEELFTPLYYESGKPLDDALTHARLVILGDPGSGKTTFLKRLTKRACAARLADAAAPFPIPVRVAELAEFAGKQDEPDALAVLPRFLAAECRKTRLYLDEEYFERQIREGPALLLIDGLDEAPNEGARKALSDLITTAAARWPHCRMTVTTRPRAYEDEELLPGFHPVSIGALEPEAIRAFLARWSAALIPEDASRAQRHADDLIRAVESRADIRRLAVNPVMLTSLALLHWNDTRMPEQRADLYESVLTWLARSREKRPGRLGAEACLARLSKLAGAMQLRAGGRQVQVPRTFAAESLADPDLSVPDAEAFLQEEEKDSGIVVNRGADLRFWHLTFQEYLAARYLAGLPDDQRNALLFAEGRAWSNEWREVVLLLAGVLHKQSKEKVDALVTGALNQSLDDSLAKRFVRWFASGPSSLTEQASCFGLLAAMMQDLQALKYTPADARFAELRDRFTGIFDPRVAVGIPLKTRLTIAEALGRAGDPRLHLPRDKAYWVLVGNFCIGKYPVTAFEYGFYVEAGGKKPPNWDRQLLRPNCPVVNVSWHDAQAYCDWAGVRLPSEAEWRRAACGPENRTYPWGDEAPDPERANYDKTGLKTVSPVGLFPRGNTPEGIADMAGNVDEWVDDWYDEKRESRVVLGGSWYDDTSFLAASSVRFRYRPGDWGEVLGFRCAREVFP